MLAALAMDAPGRASANLVFLQGHAALMRGELRESVLLLHEALAAAEHHGVATLRPACYFALVEAHAKLGEADAAAEMLEQGPHGGEARLPVHADRAGRWPRVGHRPRPAG